MALVLTVLGFLWWWPLGLLMLFLWMRRGPRCGRNQAYAWQASASDGDRGADRWDRKLDRMQHKMERLRERMEQVRGRDWFGAGGGASGNRAFDDYRAETLKRLEDEQREFKDFLARLRVARDRAEFDQFMADRRANPPAPEAPPSEPRG